MRIQNLILFCLFLLIAPVAAETISFAPGELSASVRGKLVAEQTKEYSFQGEAGQLFELAATSARGQFLLIRVRDEQKRELLSNYDSADLSLSGELPADGRYTVQLALRRAEVQREGRLDYLLTVTLHPLPELIALPGQGDYFASNAEGRRELQSVSIGLGNGGDALVRVELSGDSFTVKGRWETLIDEVAILELTEAFGQQVRGRAMIVFDDDIDDDGKPIQIFLRFDTPAAGTHHDLVFGRR